MNNKGANRNRHLIGCSVFCAALCTLGLCGELLGADVAATSPATMPAATVPATPDASGQIVITFEKAEPGKAIPSYTDKGVTITLAGRPQRSQAVGRIV